MAVLICTVDGVENCPGNSVRQEGDRCENQPPEANEAKTQHPPLGNSEQEIHGDLNRIHEVGPNSAPSSSGSEKFPWKLALVCEI